jgi:hypothetical protein
VQLDDMAAGSILGTIGDDPPGPSTVDIRRAVLDGRRKRRLRRFAGMTSASAATALVLVAVWAVAGTRGDRDTPPPAGTGVSAASSASPAASPAASAAASPSAAREVAPDAPTSCKIKRLVTPDGRKMSLVTAMDPTGRYIAGRTYPAGSGDYHVVVWDRFSPTIVDMPGEDQSITEINSSGVGVGTSYGESPSTTAWLVRDGTVTKLPGGDNGEALAINEAGVAVGSVDGHPVIWRSVDAPPVRLPVPAGWKSGSAVDIDRDGTVLGTLDSNGKQTPYLWLPDGTGRPIPELAKAYAYSLSNGIVTVLKANDNASPNPGSGSDYSEDDSTAGTFDLRTRRFHLVPGFDGRPQDGNKYGWLIGIDPQGRGRLSTDKGSVVLPDLAFHTPDGLHNIPWVMSDDGRTIGGQSDTKDEVIHAVAWTCT